MSGHPRYFLKQLWAVSHRMRPYHAIDNAICMVLVVILSPFTGLVYGLAVGMAMLVTLWIASFRRQ